MEKFAIRTDALVRDFGPARAVDHLTLLASRLSDRAILFGKIAAAVGYGLGATWISLLIGLITVNLAHGQGKLLF